MSIWVLHFFNYCSIPSSMRACIHSGGRGVHPLSLVLLDFWFHQKSLDPLTSFRLSLHRKKDKCVVSLADIQ